MERGLRKADIVEHSIARLSLYKSLNTVKIDVSAQSIHAAAEIIAAI